MRKKGVITVFFSLLLICIVSLILVLIESARMTGARYKMTMAADSAINSLFGNYDKEFYERYNILALHMNETEMSEELNKYLEYYSNVDKGLLMAGGDICRIQNEEIEIISRTNLTDNGGELFISSSIDALGYSIGETIINEISIQLNEQAEVFRQSDKMYSTVNDRVNNIKENISESDLNKLKDSDELDSNWFDYMSREVGNFILSNLLPKDKGYSSGKIETIKLPSNGLVEENNKNYNILETITFNMYLQKYFSSYTDRKANFNEKNPLKYEQEYIVSGYKSDKENLDSVAGRIFLIRQGANLITINRSNLYTGTAEALAIVITVLLGLAGMEEVIKELILFTWAYIESENDMKLLMAGGAVPIIKKESEWQTLGMNLPVWAESTSNENTNNIVQERSSIENKKINYEGYLATFIFLQESEIKCFRAMDIIEENIKQFNSAFKIKQCIYEIQVNFKFRDYRDRKNTISLTRNYK